MRKIVSITLMAILLIGIACACSDNIDIKQSYEFQITHLPVPKKLKVGQTAEIRCQLERSGKFDDARYYFRYFHPDGKGELRMDDGAIFLPNDNYDLNKKIFRLYYTSESDDQQVIDIYFFDNMGNQFQLSFSFNHDNSEE